MRATEPIHFFHILHAAAVSGVEYELVDIISFEAYFLSVAVTRNPERDNLPYFFTSFRNCCGSKRSFEWVHCNYKQYH